MGWDIATRPLTFEASGRTVVVRDAPNVYAIFGAPELAPHLDAFLAGEVKDPDVGLLITEGIARAQMVRPRIAERDEPLPADQDPEDPDVVPFSALYAPEVDELFLLWKEADARGARFRGDDDGPAAGAGGEDMGDGAEPARRPRARKSRGAQP